MFSLAVGLLLLADFQTQCEAARQSYTYMDKPQEQILRAINGTPTDPGEWPWQVLLKRNGKFWCGGTLHKRKLTKRQRRRVKQKKSDITTEYMVVTAAHCVSHLAKNYTVIFGEHNRTEITGLEQEIGVKRVVVHENYTSELENDIAILFLDKDPVLNDNVKFIPKLSTWQLDRKALKEEDCFVLGWGDIFTDHSANSDILLELKTKVLRNRRCRKGLVQANARPEWLLPTNVCTDNTFASFCSGDSGGTLQCKIDDVWTHIGIVSWAEIDCNSPFPNVYTRVSRFRRWIRKTSRMPV